MIAAGFAIELLGYVASGLVVLGLTMRSLVRLRTISLVGSITFLAYGVLIGSVPIMITNVCIAAINIWFLRREFLVKPADRDDLGVSRIRADSPFLLDFIEYHHDDITGFQPEFQMPTGDDVLALLLTRESLPAGLVVGHRHGRILSIDLDYVLREHRDSRLGAWLYGPGRTVFREAGFTELRAVAVTAAHDKYLRRVGFDPPDDKTGEFALVL
ncbi:MAG: hypothetical protein ABJH68_15515 [Ilumatobacter sp.]|uniref:hypothetical protein n=1 Tax=Ilumatobacter sp. TaxID=1967498 RepID=UPI003296CC84